MDLPGLRVFLLLEGIRGTCVEAKDLVRKAMGFCANSFQRRRFSRQLKNIKLLHHLKLSVRQ